MSGVTPKKAIGLPYTYLLGLHQASFQIWKYGDSESLKCTQGNTVNNGTWKWISS